MPPDIVKETKGVVIDNSPRGRLISLLGAFNLDVAKPWVDEAIAEAITNIGRELEARCEGEKRSHKTAYGVEVPTVEGEAFNEGIDHTITLIRSITGISPTR